MIYIVVPNDQSKRLTFYLATEEYIARHLPPQEYFFIWQVNPTVIFGRNQLIDTEVNLDFCRKNNINLFRRKSGGGCVYADQGNLMLACITPERQVGFTFQRYTQRIVTLLNQLGVKAVASGRNDISVDQKKISGNAFYKVGIQNIVHGTLLFDTDLDQLEQAITPSQSKLISKGVQSVRQRVTNLSNYLDMDLPSFKHYLRTQLCADREIVLDDRDLEIIKEMEQEYLDPQFIQGKNPPYQIIRQKRTRSAGEITAKIELKKQTIKSIHLHGDFFAPCSLEEEIYPLLLHQPYEPNKITAIINKIDIGKYILNLSNQEFINLLFEEDTPSLKQAQIQSNDMEENMKTCLYEKHVALGAKMSPFGGFDMPIEYSSIIEEHQAVRQAAGIFDVSHMGEILITGKDAEKYVNQIFTNDLTQAPIGKIYYGLMLYPHGGAVDDLLVYKMEENHFFLVVNASNIEKDFQWMQANQEGYEVLLQNLSDQYGEVAVQGPKASCIIEKYLQLPVEELVFYTFKEYEYKGEKILISRTGYTGEDGFELYGTTQFINQVWDLLLDSKEVAPCGLGCRDTLRFEVGLPLYGHELSEKITPLEAGLGSFVKLDKPEFIGKEALLKQKEEGLKQKVVGIELKDKAIPRNGYIVERDGQEIGYVTTGYHSISAEKSVCMALIDASQATLGNEVNIKIRKKNFPGTIVKKRFYQKNYKK